MRLLPAIEGICARTEEKETYAVRTERGAIAVRIVRVKRRDVLRRVPVLRGMFRLGRAVASPLHILGVSQDMHPQQLTRPSAEGRTLSKALHLRRLTLTGLRSAAIIIVFALAITFLPLLLDQAVLGWPVAARTAILCCLRIALLLLSVRLLFRLKFLRRIAMCRGAANKVADCLRRGKPLDIENALTGRRLAAESDPAFLLLTAVLLIIAGAVLPLDFSNLLQRVLARAGLTLVLAGLLNEALRPIERRPDSPLHLPLDALQRTFTMEPHSEMLEVAITAVRAARGELCPSAKN